VLLHESISLFELRLFRIMPVITTRPGPFSIIRHKVNLDLLQTGLIERRRLYLRLLPSAVVNLGV